MKHEPPNPQEEQKLCAAAKRATDLVNSGLEPDDAVEKVAREERYGPGQIRMMAHAYNTGQQTDQWRGGGTILDKLATFTLADPEKVIARVFHGQSPAQKEASLRVDAEYLFPPTWLTDERRVKLASAPLPVVGTPVEPYQPDPMHKLNQAYALAQRHKQACEELSRQASHAEDNVRSGVAALIGYFKQANYARLPFEVVDSAARTYYGTPGVALMDMVHQRSKTREKRAGDTPPQLTAPLDLRAEPFTLIAQCIKAAEHCGRCRQALATGQEKAAADKEAAFRPFLQAGTSVPQKSTQLTLPSDSPWDVKTAAIFDVPAVKGAGWAAEVAAIATGDAIATKAMHEKERNDDPYGDVGEIDDEVGAIDRAADKAIKGKKPFKKEAILNSAALGSALGTVLGRTVGSAPKTKDDLISDAWMDLEDPEHQNELRKIRAHTMLSGMLTDPEDPISGHSPDKVLQAYNEISQMSPRVAENAASLRPHLRRRLEGHTEPFEVKEITDTEKNLAAAKHPTPNTNLLHDAPSSILG